MLEIRRRADASAEARTLTLTLPFEQRQRSRLRVTLGSGEEAGLFLPRGTVLRGGDLLALEDGRVVEVLAAAERVSTVRTSDLRKLAQAAYHLGNRHVPLEVGDGYVRYLHDHVLDDLVRGLGLAVTAESAAFEPEHGAYGAAGHAHGHSHGHHHAHDHDHDHDHA